MLHFAEAVSSLHTPSQTVCLQGAQKMSSTLIKGPTVKGAVMWHESSHILIQTAYDVDVLSYCGRSMTSSFQKPCASGCRRCCVGRACPANHFRIDDHACYNAVPGLPSSAVISKRPQHSRRSCVFHVDAIKGSSDRVNVILVVSSLNLRTQIGTRSLNCDGAKLVGNVL